MASELGYYFHPSDCLQTLGPSQLEVNLYEQPTQEHFDPERATFLVIGADGEVRPLTFVHPWQGAETFRVCAGRIMIIDRREKVVEAFSLGGELSVTVQPDHTHCVLSSTTPIVESTASQNVLGLLIAEFEALLARQQAEWNGNDVGFHKRLANIDAFTLLVAGLATIGERLKHLPLTNSHQQTIHALHRAIQTLQQQNRWPATVPTLDQLL